MTGLCISFGRRTINAPVPVEIIAADSRRVWSGLVDMDGTTTARVEPGDYLIQARLPNGSVLHTQQSVNAGQTAEAVFEPTAGTHDEPAGWTRYLQQAVQPAPPSPLAPPQDRLKGLHLASTDAPGVVFTIWACRGSQWSQHEFPLHEPYPLVPGEISTVELPFRGDPYWLCCRAGGGKPLFVAVPQVGNVRPQLALAWTAESGLSAAVGGFDPAAEALLSFMNGGDFASARALEPRTLRAAETLLHDKVDNPVAATIAAYYLLKVGAIDKLHNWTFNLARLSPTIPDTHVIAAWHALRSSPPKHDLARHYFEAALEQGVPLFSLGAQMLLEGLLHLHSTERTLDLTAHIERAAGYAHAANPASGVLVFSAYHPAEPRPWSQEPDPQEPGPSGRRWTKMEERRVRLERREHARELGRSNRLDEAEEIYNQLLWDNPNDAGSLRDYADFLSMQPRRQLGAEELYARALSVSPLDTAVLARYAVFLSRQPHRLEDAEALYSRCLDIDPNNSNALLGYAILLENDQARSEQVAGLYERLLATAPDNPLAFRYAAAFFADQRPEQAEQLYKHLISIEPSSRSTTDYAAFLAGRAGRAEEAEALFNRALALDPRNPITLARFASLLADRPERRAQAAELYTRAIASEPHAAHPAILTAYASFLGEDPNHYSEAEELFRRAINASEGNPSTIARYALFLSRQPARKEEALTAFFNALRRDPANDLARIGALTLLIAAFDRTVWLRLTLETLSPENERLPRTALFAVLLFNLVAFNTDQSDDRAIRQLKRLLQNAGPLSDWPFEVQLAHLRAEHHPDLHHLQTLALVINGQAEASALDTWPRWRNAHPPAP